MVTSVPSASMRTEPSGMLEIETERVSPLSVSAASMFRAIAWSSAPVASVRSKVGASATAATETFRVPDVTAVSVPSVEVATTSRAISPDKSAGGVRLRPSNWSGDRVAVPPMMVTSVPSARVSTAPSGMLEMETLRFSPESVKAASMLRAIAWSSEPAASVNSRVGASATAVTETFRVPEVVAVSVPSVEVATTSRAMSPAKSVGGVSCKPVS